MVKGRGEALSGEAYRQLDEVVGECEVSLEHGNLHSEHQVRSGSELGLESAGDGEGADGGGEGAERRVRWKENAGLVGSEDGEEPEEEGLEAGVVLGIAETWVRMRMRMRMVDADEKEDEHVSNHSR